jgi:hypothetical protein
VHPKILKSIAGDDTLYSYVQNSREVLFKKSNNILAKFEVFIELNMFHKFEIPFTIFIKSPQFSYGNILLDYNEIICGYD